ncbi:CPBP family intramembrane metalloprotease [Aquimarina sp. AD1]|uniref:CPBP family intramembrane glutamic endopeptidase n=1 Tax=Aquimarina sp. (strain AD1) TaxID=1714848 RepID=UPI000E472FAB|nr:CPBP family intramembrane glutamic endopeptidase [Aquimarina sp. AD1]AXT55306.1 CPBP family intramembrane metalloprotease [Aquimarina sp. AD1]RKN09182.1 CPBP family intramembrane metalloprotease [Aquimarina sp. AD1]
MYIEQGRKGKLGMWKYLPVPIGFLGLILFNLMFTQGVDIDVLMAEQIETLGKPLFFLISVGPFVIFLAGLLFWVKVVHQQSITSLTTSRKRIDWKRVLFMFTLITLYILITTGVLYYLYPEDFQLNFEFDAFITLAIMAIIIVPMQTSFEEYLFRGHMMQGLGLATKTRWIPLIVTSVIFGAMHFGNPEVAKIGPHIMVYYIGTGLFLGIITLMDEGLELALGFHAANNLITALLVTSSWTAFQTDSILLYTGEPETGLEILIPVFVVFPIYILILWKKYKWSGWRDKLFGKVKPEIQMEK